MRSIDFEGDTLVLSLSKETQEPADNSSNNALVPRMKRIRNGPTLGVEQWSGIPCDKEWSRNGGIFLRN